MGAVTQRHSRDRDALTQEGMAPRDYETVSAPGSWPAVRSATRDFLDKPESSCAAFAFKYFMLFAILSAVTLMVLGSLGRRTLKR